MDLMELVVKIKADTEGLTSQLDSIGNTVSKWGSNLSGIASAVGNVAWGATKMAAKGIYDITRQSVNAFGQFQQLEGGVQTLFGTAGMNMEEYAESVGATVSEISGEYRNLKQAEDLVFENSKKAFSEAGLSMNQYMEQATTMAASLKQSLGGDALAAAQYADTAIKDMSDNANKMGTNIQAIQNAYQGFSKQNYTMLDNLKLGYGGTKHEMERLLKDAQELKAKNGEIVEYSIDSYADIVDAIHTIQVETGIYNTTLHEAGTTITGSLQSVQAAWENVLTTIASGNDSELNTQIDNFISSAKVAVENLIPTIVNALKGLGKMIKELAPVISKELPGLLKSIIPDLVSAAATMLKTAIPIIAELLPGLIKDIGPTLVAAFVELFTVVVENFPTIISGLIDAFSEMGDIILQTLDNTFPAVSDAIRTVINIFETLEPVIWAVVGAFVAYKAALLITELIAAVNAVIATLTALTEGQTIAQLLLNAATAAFPGTWLVAIIGAVVGALVYLWTTSEDFRDGFCRVCELVWSAVQLMGDIIVGVFAGLIEWIVQLGKDFASFFVDGILAWKELFIDFGEALKEKWDEFCGWVEQKIEDLKGWFDDFGGSWHNLMVKLGIETEEWTGKADVSISNLANNTRSNLGGLKDESYSWGHDMTSQMASGIEDGGGIIKSRIQALTAAIRSQLHFSRPDEGPLRDYEEWMPDFMEGLAEGIDNNRYLVEDALSGLTTNMSGAFGDMSISTPNIEESQTEGGDIIIPIYLPDGNLWEEIVINAQNQHNYRSGGR